MTRDPEKPASDPSPSRRGRFWALVRLIALNGLVLLGLLCTLNAVAAIVLRLSPEKTALGDDLATLPNYRGVPNASKIISETDAVGQTLLYAPYRVFRLGPFKGDAITVDRAGDRVNAAQPSPPRGAPVARFFGGSAMFGYGADDAHTIPAYFARRHPAYEVVNHGTPAANARQNLEHLINLMTTGARTDLALFYVGVNDVSSLCRKDVSLNGHADEAHVRTVLERSPADSPSLRAAAETVVYKKTEELLRRELQREDISPYRCSTEPRRAREVADVVMRDLEFAHDLVTRAGGLLVAALQPDAYVGRPRADHLRRTLSDGRLRAQYRAVYPLLRARIKARRARWLADFTDAFDTDDYIYIDDAHVSAPGNAIMARRFGRLLERACSGSRCRAAAG